MPITKLLVTGGAGFIGSHLVDALLADGYAVTVLDNFDPFYDLAIKEANVSAHLSQPRYTLVRADIRDGEALHRALPGDFDAVIHLAGKAGVRPSIVDPLGYQQTNVAGTQNLLEFTRARGIERFVFASSSSVYGVSPETPWREDMSALMPISPYASTKVSGELLGHVYSHLYGIRFVGLRFFTVYGPRQRPDLAIHKFARMMLAGERIPVFGDGTTRRDYTYVSDIVAGIKGALDLAHGSRYEIVNLGNDRTVTLSEMIRELEHALGVDARLEWLPEQPGDVPQTWASIDKARALLGYEPRTPFAEGIGRFVEWINRPQMPGPMLPGGEPMEYADRVL